MKFLSVVFESTIKREIKYVWLYLVLASISRVFHQNNLYDLREETWWQTDKCEHSHMQSHSAAEKALETLKPELFLLSGPPDLWN
jgi:hypothetical protein